MQCCVVQCCVAAVESRHLGFHSSDRQETRGDTVTRTKASIGSIKEGTATRSAATAAEKQKRASDGEETGIGSGSEQGLRQQGEKSRHTTLCAVLEDVARL